MVLLFWFTKRSKITWKDHILNRFCFEKNHESNDDYVIVQQIFRHLEDYIFLPIKLVAKFFTLIFSLNIFKQICELQFYSLFIIKNQISSKNFLFLVEHTVGLFFIWPLYDPLSGSRDNTSSLGLLFLRTFGIDRDHHQKVKSFIF